ncbi:DUF4177 domain-containing protein [Pseudoroseicyclus sp. CXY001]|uniref:DUF4177 domain-containing protein n=1 Tax=Pseudoroseicyclus sp. CXY001 TaxID=3242492 RepID=UPI0035711AAB
MQTYEYRVVPAPKKGLKAKGVKTAEARFAHALQALMNELGAEGWDYIRTDTLPSEERTGLTGRTTTSYQNMLVFRRPLLTATIAEAAPAAEPQAPALPAPEPAPAPAAEAAPEAKEEPTEPSPLAPSGPARIEPPAPERIGASLTRPVLAARREDEKPKPAAE